MIVAVTGGRNWQDRFFTYGRLRDFHEQYRITELHEGGANGWDAHCRKWALDNGIQAFTYWANWKGNGLAAGHMRNKLILDRAKPEWLIAGPGGPGTANMIKQAGERGIKIFHAQPMVPMRDMQSD